MYTVIARHGLKSFLMQCLLQYKDLTGILKPFESSQLIMATPPR